MKRALFWQGCAGGHGLSALIQVSWAGYLIERCDGFK